MIKMRPVVHFEIPAENLERAKKFYGDIFGWNIMDVPGVDYTMLTTIESDEQGFPKKPGAINGGMMKKEGSGLSPVIVIDVESIDEYIERVKKAGGEVVMEKVKVMDMGYNARIKDTEGNIIGLWENISSPK